MTWTADSIQARLAPRAVRYFEQIGSTNDEARDWLQQRGPTGAVVIADLQTAGRGRMGRTWHTPPGAALAVSYILRPPMKNLHRVSMIGALAVYDVAIELGLTDLGIKWPNDVLVNGRKVSGVLPEVAWDGDKLLGVVLGIGLNISVDFANTELVAKAISLQTALGQPIDRLDVLAALLTCLDDWSARIESEGVFETWRDRLMMLGRNVTIVQQGETLFGTAESVDEQGALYIREANGQINRVVAGDIALG